ncbi:DNA polymerase III subunit epsilon [Pseudoalteromonas sp. BSi20652]|uniref:3'-5' exonuclease n=1 Tax=Pseudoalteromonas sp. BSi20652 TaxID=388384 RepID=UPI0002318630|nr:3'-5' exonuclease [Pseudoalteromonas sp. BSi20652]GAA59349.1 DNA polymerase III subunit epsilon [Pseudoalteromonas sp. BSi20652]
MAFKKNTVIDWSTRYEQLINSTENKVLKNFYSSAFNQPLAAIKDVPFVAMDFETTGLNSKDDDIVSVGLIPFNFKRIYCKHSRHWVVQPRRNLHEESIVIHGITHSEVDDAPDFNRIIDPLLEALSGKVVVVHYAAIERQFLNNALLLRLKEGIEFALVDTMEIERKALQAKHGILGKLFNTKLGSLRLTHCRERYSLPVYKNHNALTDALATAELLQAQLSYHYKLDTPISKLWE